MSRSSTLWKVYLWCFSAIYILLFPITIVYEKITPISALSSLLDIGCIVGMMGFVYRRRLFVRSLWKIWWFVAVCAEILVIVKHGRNPSAFVIIFGVLSMPLYISLFLYAFVDMSIWDIKGK